MHLPEPVWANLGRIGSQAPGARSRAAGRGRQQGPTRGRQTQITRILPRGENSAVHADGLMSGAPCPAPAPAAPLRCSALRRRGRVRKRATCFVGDSARVRNRGFGRVRRFTTRVERKGLWRSSAPRHSLRAGPPEYRTRGLPAFSPGRRARPYRVARSGSRLPPGAGWRKSRASGARHEPLDFGLSRARNDRRGTEYATERQRAHLGPAPRARLQRPGAPACARPGTNGNAAAASLRPAATRWSAAYAPQNACSSCRRREPNAARSLEPAHRPFVCGAIAPPGSSRILFAAAKAPSGTPVFGSSGRPRRDTFGLAGDVSRV